VVGSAEGTPPLWRPWIRQRYELSAPNERQLLRISPRQMDRRLRPLKTHLRRRLYGRTKPGTLLKHHIPIKTDHWDVSSPGFTEVDLVGAYDYFKKTHYVDTIGSLSPFVALTVLNAEFTAGPFEGRQPQYAPKSNLRFGTIYSWRDRVKVSLLSTFMGDHFADDASSANYKVPSYKVWDLTADIHLLKNIYGTFDLGIFGGINNLFDEKYFARVRSDGIDPAYRRNLYGGVKVKWG